VAKNLTVAQVLKCEMLATPEYEMAGTVSFASLTDAIAVGWSSEACNVVCLLLKRLLKMVNLLLNAANILQALQYCSSWKSSLSQYCTVVGRKLQNEYFSIKEETTSQFVYGASTTEH
jgi:hypothetical protein